MVAINNLTQSFKTSRFKNPNKNKLFLNEWVKDLELKNGYEYDKFSVKTSLGNTQIYGLNTLTTERETLVVLPGYRTTSLIWDLDSGLQNLAKTFRIFMVEINGQPNLSDGDSPQIKTLDYGYWLNEVFIALKISKAFIAGASFGGLVCMKFAITNSEKIKAVILLNPGCLRSISFKVKNLYYNFLPIASPRKSSITKFLDAIIFNSNEKSTSKEAEQHLVKYLLFAIRNHRNKAHIPYYMKSQLQKVKVDTYLILGKKDILFPYKICLKNAKKHLGNHLKEVFMEDFGHGIELHKPALMHISDIINRYK